MKQSADIKAYGKVNLSLNITGVRGNMHELESVVSKVDLFDEVQVAFDTTGKITVVFDTDGIGELNSAVSAVEFLQSFCPELGANVNIKKGIPIAGGLGGSSADAAAIIKAALMLMPERFDGVDIISKSVCVGSDVPALLGANCVLMSGIGESVEPIAAPKLHLVIADGGGGVNSGQAYKEFDNLYKDKTFCPSNTSALIAALKSGDLAGISHELKNALTLPAIKLNPKVQNTLDMLSTQNAEAVFMTGSGSCCCGLFPSEQSAIAAAENLRKTGLWAVYAPTVI